MRTINGIFVGCFVSLITVGCSLQKLDPLNEGNAGKSTGGSAGDSAAGRSSRGGTTSNGGTSTSTGRTTSSSSITVGQTSEGGSASIGGSSGNDGTTSNSGSSNTTVGGTSSTGGSSVLTGGTSSIGGSKATGGTTSSVVGGSAATGGTTSAGSTSAVGLAIATPTLPTGKTYVAYSGTVTASGATSYSWSISSGSLPSGLTLQNTTSATVTIAGTPTEVGLYPVKLAVTDGVRATTIDAQVAVTHKVAFLSDRITSGVKELFLVEVGAETVADPVRLSAAMSTGGITSFAWSPDGAKIAYLAGTQLYVVDLSTPGTATLAAVQVSRYAWLSHGQSLAVARTGGDVVTIDVSSAPPWATQSIPLATIDTGRKLSSTTIKVSPRNRDFGLTRILDSSDGSGKPSWEIYQVTWTAGSAPIVGTIAPAGNGEGIESYSYDGSIVTSAANGAHFTVSLANPSTPALLFSVHGGAPAWSPTTVAQLTRNDQIIPEPSSINLRTPSGSTWSTTVLATPTCPADFAPLPWSPDGANGVFLCGIGLRGIASVATATAGRDVALLPADFGTNSFTNMGACDWSPDSKWIKLHADRFADGTDELFLVRFSAPGAATRPYTTIAAPGISASQFSPNSAYIAYVGILGTTTLPSLYLSQLPSAGTPTSASLATPPNSPSVQRDIAWLPGSRVLLYRTNDAGGAQLHTTPLSSAGGSGNSISVTGAYGTGVSTYQPAPTR